MSLKATVSSGLTIAVYTSDGKLWKSDNASYNIEFPSSVSTSGGQLDLWFVPKDGAIGNRRRAAHGLRRRRAARMGTGRGGRCGLNER